jgi:tRNA threonylcarbamoyladenosine biosynthesis protein TsaB
MIILNLETSTNVCSISLSENDQTLFKKADFNGMNHAALLSLFIQEALDLLKEENKKPNAVAISAGPGSYTGLRIGVSTAKGLCYGFGIPLIAINTLELIAYSAINQCFDKNSLYCAMIDARRMEVYSIFVDSSGKIVRKVSADIIDENSYKDILEKQVVYFFGNGAEKCKSLLSHSNARFIENVYPLAENMFVLANKAFLEQKFEDVAYFEPFYLKEFQATTPKTKL